MIGPMRIALVSYAAEGFAILQHACERSGHTPVVYVHGRSLRPGGPSRPGAGAVVKGIVDVIPPGMDLLLPGSTDGLARTLSGYQADLIVCYGFAWRFPLGVLQMTRLGGINVHTSMLPRYRGPIPVHWAIRNGDPEIGVTVHWMDEQFDTGSILVQEGHIPLADDVVPTELWRDVDQAISRLLPAALERVVAGHLGEPQDAASFSYAGWMEPSFSEIDWGHSARMIHNQVRTLRFGSSGVSGPKALLDGAWVTVVRTSLESADGVR